MKRSRAGHRPAGQQRWWLTLKLLVLKPGELTRACVHGRRKPLVTPLTPFLALNVVFFLSQTLSGVAMLLISLSAQFQNQGYSALANHWVDQRVSKQAVGGDRCQVTFDLRQQTLGKAGVIALVPPFEALCAVALWCRRLPLRTHSIFASHFYSFSMLLMFLLITLVGIAANTWAASGQRAPGRRGAAEPHRVVDAPLGDRALVTRRIYCLTLTLHVLVAMALVTATFLAMYAHRVALVCRHAVDELSRRAR